MLFPYIYVPHQMEKMQELIRFIFYEVWCKAPSFEYGIDIFKPCEGLHQIMEELHRRDLAEKLKDGSGKDFYESINEIFNEFKKLSNLEIDQYQRDFDSNNMIEELCSGSLEHVPTVYVEVPDNKKELNEKIQKFFKNIYSSGFFNLAFVKEVVGSDLGRYYKDFVRKNDTGTCPFCGLLPIDGEYDPTREAFDHYLPKSKYPFNSVNLKNLAPSCGKCNSGNKIDQDPLRGVANRRKAFYPFSLEKTGIELSVKLNAKCFSNGGELQLRPEGIEIEIQSTNYFEEVNTWKELFRIETRYVAKCCSNNGGLNWLNRVLSECQNYNLAIPTMLDAELKSAEASPWVESNFLKKAFLEGCQQVGLFNMNRGEEVDLDEP